MKKQLLLLLFAFFSHLTVFAQPCNANAGPDTSICLGATATLGGIPAGTGAAPITYSWSPGTNLSCTNCPNPVVTALGNQNYVLTITADNGCTDTDLIHVTVDAAPTAGFNINNNNACANLPIAFTNISSGSGLTYSWNFGDTASGASNTSTATNPTHLFQAFGSGSTSYTVVLTVTNAAGCSATVNHTVTVQNTPNPALLDPLTSMKNCGGGSYTMTVFDASSTTSISNYQIIWGDGSPNFNSGSFPGGGVSHNYSTSEVFTMNYIITGTNGCVDSVQYNVANITNPAIGAANPGATTGCGPVTLCFPLNNYASNHPTTYYVVNYGDGSPLVTLPHPPPAVICHTYSTSSCGQPGNQFIFRIKAINLCDSSEATISPIRVYLGPQANFNLTAPSACVNSTVTFLNTTVGGFNSSCSASTLFNWDFGNGTTLTTPTLTNPTTVYTIPGTYTVTLTTTNSCGSTVITRTICIESPPVPNFTIDPDTACAPYIAQVTDASTLTNTCNITRTWSVIFNGSPCLPSSGAFAFVGSTNASSVNPQIQFTQPGNYTLRLTLTNSCGSFILDKPIVVQAPPQITLAAVPSVCVGASVNPSATVLNCLEPVDTYNWTFTGGSPASSTTLIPGSISYASAGTFPIQLEATNACGTTTASTSVVIKPLPPVLNPAVNSPICVGQAANFTSDASASTTYTWTGPNSFSSSSQNFTIPAATLAQAGTYTVFGTLNGCPGPVSSVNLVVNPLPVITITPPSASICLGDSVTLTANGASTYVWSPSVGLNSTTTSTINASPPATQLYTVTGTLNGCSASTSANVTVNPIPIVNAGNDTTVCNQPIPFNLIGTPAGGTWTGSNVSPTGTFTPNGTGTFTLTYTFTSAAGCDNFDTVHVSVISPSPANAGTDTTVCKDSPLVTLTASPLGGTWSGTNVTTAGVFNPNTVGTFTLVYTFGAGACLVRDTLLATVTPLPVVDAGSNFSSCIDASNAILAGTPAGGTWTGTGIIASSGTFSPSTAGVGSFYEVYTYIDLVTGCSNKDSLLATINPLPIVNAGPDSTVCNQPLAFQLGASPSGGTWSGLNVSPSGQFTPNGNGIFTLTYSFTNANGCTNTDTRDITVTSPPTPNAGVDFAVCIDAPNVNLTPTPLGGIWSGTDVSLAGIFNPTTAGNFSLVYTLGAGSCLVRDTLIATVNPLPIVNAGNDFALCVDALDTLLVGSPVGGTWSGTGIMTSAGNFSPSTAGTGTHILTYAYTDLATSCSSSDTRTITVNALPVVNAGIDSTMCNAPISVHFNSTPIGGVWSGAPITPTGNFTPPGIGSYTFTYTFTNANGCVNADSRVITVIDPTQPNAGSDFGVCIDAPNVNLTPTPLGGTWSGTDVSIGGIFNPTTAGTFPLVYSYGSGNCLLRDTIIVTVNPLPIVNAGNDFALCIDAPDSLLVGSPLGGTWSGTGMLTAAGNFSPSTAGVGTHTLTYLYTNPATGCTSSDTRNITINSLPLVNAGIDSTLCNTPFAVQFSASPIGGTWSGAPITPTGSFTPATSGAFTFTYSFTNANGCVNTDSRVITVIDPTVPNAGADFSVCIDAPNVTLNATPLGGIWTGTDVTGAGIFNPTTAGNYPLVYSYGSGNCLQRDTLIATVNPLPIVTVGTDVVYCQLDENDTLIFSPVGGTWSGNGLLDVNLGIYSPPTAAIGTHNLVYTYIEPATGCVNKDSLLATVHPMPTADFTYTSIVCLNDIHTYTNTSAGGTTYNWDFGDGNSTSIFQPNYAYTTAGFYDIELLVTTAFGCQDSIEQTIEVRVPPVANFVALPDSACGPVTVNFVDQSTGPNLSYSWDYGNGQISTGPVPLTQTYTQGTFNDSIYNVVLTLTNSCGTDQDTVQITAMPQPVAIFGTSTNNLCSPTSLDFVNNSYGLVDTFSWDFGDGTFSDTAATTFQHAFWPGINDTTYTITLIASNECGADTISHQVIIHPILVNAFFNTDDPDGCAPHTVNFTQFSQGSTFSSWDFGDGNLSASYNISHTYTTPGTYVVSLFANDGCGYDTTSVLITVFPGPQVDFSSNPDSVCINQAFTFTNLSTNIASSSWDFGDGGTSALTNPQYSYSASGTYTVTLQAISQTNGCPGTVSHPIVVSTNPVAAFTPSPTAGCMPLTVQFTNQSTNYSFQAWNFGDGNTSIQQSPTHTFTQAGTFTVHLYVENANGCGDSIEQIITVYPLPVAAFDIGQTEICATPYTPTFTNLSTGAMNYEWDLGNGQTSSLTNPSTTYSTIGSYTVSLIATSIHGCKDTIAHQFTINQPASVNFNYTPSAICMDQSITVNATSSFADSLVWNFGDGTLINGNNITYTYASSGTFPISVIAYGMGGCNDTMSANGSQIIMQMPTAAFNYETVATEPLNGTVQFNNTSSNADYYLWEFGIDSTSGEINPVVQYPNDGEYEVMLIAYTNFGCTDTTWQTIMVDFFYGLFIPNAIVPGHSEFGVANFIPKGVGLKTFELLIYDDWGNLIWSTNALDSEGRPTEYWDGTYRGEPVQQDAYVWKCIATFKNEVIWEGKEYQNGVLKRSGSITVIR